MAALLALAGVVGFIALVLRQPLIVAFIAVGLLAGPSAMGLIGHNGEFIHTLAELGVSILLFTVGLKLDLKLIRRLGPSALATGMLQVALSALFGGCLAWIAGFDSISALVTGIAMSFSSTIIVVKLLSDKRAIDSLYGKMALGILIIQDVVVIAAMLMMTGLASSDPSSVSSGNYWRLMAQLLGLLIFTGVFIRFIATPLTAMLARAPELMMTFAVAFVALMAAVCEYCGLGKELGGLLAGVALASTPQHNVIASRLSPLRDFLLLFFFVALGVRMDLSNIGTQIVPALVLSAFVLVGKPLLIMLILRIQKYRRRVGFLTGVSLAQVSEFSLIFMAMAATAGLASAQAMTVMTLVGLMTMAFSSYMIIYNTAIFAFVERVLKFPADDHNPLDDDLAEHAGDETYDVIIFGMGRYGTAMARTFMGRGYSVLGVDFDPQTIRDAKQKGIHVIYGDAADPDTPVRIPVDTAKVVILAFHHYMTGPMITDLRRTVAKTLREQGYTGHIAATSHHLEHDVDLPQHGVDIVLAPYDDASVSGADQIIRQIGER